MIFISHGPQIVLKHHLDKYPDDVSFHVICEMLEEGSNEVDICDEFTMWGTDYLIKV